MNTFPAFKPNVCWELVKYSATQRLYDHGDDVDDDDDDDENEKRFKQIIIIILFVP